MELSGFVTIVHEPGIIREIFKMKKIFDAVPPAPVVVAVCGILVGCQTNSAQKSDELALATASIASIDEKEKSDNPGTDWKQRVEKKRQKYKLLREERLAKRKARLAPVNNKSKAGETASQIGNKNYAVLIAKYASEHGVPFHLARAVVQVESSFRSNVTGAAGEIGLMQIKLATARGMGYKGSRKALYDPATNLYWGMKYLGKAHRLSDGTTCGTILKYNAGHGATRMNRISARYCGKVKKILA